MTDTTNTAPVIAPSVVAGSVTPGLAADDPRLVFAKAVALGGSVIAGVRADQLTGPTPCDRYDVRLLLGHLVSVLRRLAAVARGESPFSVPDETTGVADDGWSDAWLAAAHEVQREWGDAAVLDRLLVLPWAEMPGRVALPIYTSEVTTHTWDLATATGQTPMWDDEVVAVSRAAMAAALPAEMRVEGVPFGAVVPVSADASPIEHLVAWVGRNPR